MSIAFNCPNAPYAADQLIMALTCGFDDHGVGAAYAQLAQSLGAQPHVMESLSPEARNAYLLALIVRAAA